MYTNKQTNKQTNSLLMRIDPIGEMVQDFDSRRSCSPLEENCPDMVCVSPDPRICSRFLPFSRSYSFQISKIQLVDLKIRAERNQLAIHPGLPLGDETRLESPAYRSH